MTVRGHYRRFRAPQNDGEILCVPKRDQLIPLVESNRQRLQQQTLEILGHPLQELSDQARAELREAASRYTRKYCDVKVDQSSDGPLILTGHQPGFVHAGVWLKNFAAARLSNESQGIVINLVIDNDLCRQSAIPIPTGSKQDPRTTLVAYDSDQPAIPYEERQILDRSMWESFGERATEAIAPFVEDPMIAHWWPQVKTQNLSPKNLGLAIAQARHQRELQWGVSNLELPWSCVCQTDVYRVFSLALIVEAKRFLDAYNASLAHYRLEHRLRNQAQPLPNLERRDEWIETPFWVWKEEDPTRRPLFVKQTSGNLQLSNLSDWEGILSESNEVNVASAIAKLADWESAGIKLRSRALTTTLFSRLFLADLFIHGIGGAKYDQVTDEICKIFWGIKLPEYLTISGTLRLPIEAPRTTQDDIRHWERRLRDLTFHPERFLVDQALSPEDQREVDLILSEKEKWVRTARTPQNAAEKHQQITDANFALQPWIQAERKRTKEDLYLAQLEVRANKLLQSREHPFCLFPQQLIQSFLLDF